VGEVSIQLVLTFCMLAWQTHCTEERPLIQNMTLVGCMVEGQQIAQDWLASHPKWTLNRWRCEHNVPRQVPS
jgi:hypothetical protein